MRLWLRSRIAKPAPLAAPARLVDLERVMRRSSGRGPKLLFFPGLIRFLIRLESFFRLVGATFVLGEKSMAPYKICPNMALFTAVLLFGAAACSNDAPGNSNASAGSPGVGGGASSAGSNNLGGSGGLGGANSGGGNVATGGSSVTMVDAGPLGCGSGNYAFCDDFEDGNATGWTSAEQSDSTPGDWNVASDNGPSGAPTYSFQQTAVNTGHHYQYPNAPAGSPWNDQTVTAWVKPTNALGDDATKVGVCGRVTATSAANSLSGYCIFLRTDGTGTTGKLQVSKKVSGSSMASMDTSTAAVPLFAKDTW